MTEALKRLLTALVTLMRPAQWLKNSFVFAPLLFSHRYRQFDDNRAAVLAALSFCLISSAVYIFNDLCDRNEDRNHPVKKNRPLASGAVRPGDAILLMIALTAGALVLSPLITGMFVWVVLAYGLLSLSYSLAFKHIAILDVMVIAAGFLLRILAGSVAIGVRPSHWILLCTIMISLFLGFAKRRAELIACGTDQAATRLVLRDYSVKFLDQIIAIVTGATIICYALYTVDARTCSSEVFGTRAMILTVPCVIYGIFRYLYIMYHLEKGEDPTQTLIRDIPSLVNLLVWVGISWLVIGWGGRLDRYLIDTFFSH